MKRPRILNGFSSMSGARLLAKTNSIIAAMSANFATAPDLPALITARDAFATALAAAQQGSVSDKAAKDEKKAVLINQLYHVGDWVIYTCNGDRAMAISSGFTISAAEPTPAPPVSPAKYQTLTDGPNAGELVYRFKRVPGAIGYIYQITPHPITAETVWTDKTGSTTRVTFSGLESGKRYWARVQAIGKDEQCVNSEPISRVSQ